VTAGPAAAAPRSGTTAVREVVFLWVACFAAILVCFPFSKSAAKVAATVGFLYLPLLAMRRRGEDYSDYGVSLRAWRADLKWFVVMSVVVLPLFAAGFAAFAHGLPLLPAPLAQLLAPYTSSWHPFRFRLPAQFGQWVVDQCFVVALPEEFFYRGYLQARLRDAWPRGRVLFGVRLGPAFFVTAALFALGHLAIFQVWRLGVFFPALLFGWMREKTGSVLGAAAFHAACNLTVLVLEESFYR
jgi:membrane protease YdiL (CAAX protease family)